MTPVMYACLMVAVMMAPLLSKTTSLIIGLLWLLVAVGLLIKDLL